MTTKKSANKKSDNVPLIPRLESDDEEEKRYRNQGTNSKQTIK